MKFNRTQIITGIAFIHMAFFAIWYAAELYNRSNTHAIIKVETVAYDPRDLLSGQYIRLRYPFETLIERGSLGSIKDWAHGFSEECIDTGIGHILFEKDPASEHHIPYHIVCGEEDMEVSEENMALRVLEMPAYLRDGKPWGRLHFGMDRFYVPEGTPEPSRREILTVEIGISKGGIGRVRNVYLKGEPLIKD